MSFIEHIAQLSAGTISVRDGTNGLRYFRNSSYTSLLRSAMTLCRCTYWYRRWIIQELVLARSVVLLWGKAVLPFVELENFINRLRPHRDNLEVPMVNEVFEGMPARVSSLRSAAITSAPRCPLLGLLESFREAKCALVIDRVYSLLELAEERQQITVDYGIPLKLLMGRILHELKWLNASSFLDSIDDGSGARFYSDQSRLIYRGLTAREVENLASHREDTRFYGGRITRLFDLPSAVVPPRPVDRLSVLLETELQIPRTNSDVVLERSQAMIPKIFLSDQGLFGVTSGLTMIDDVLIR